MFKSPGRVLENLVFDTHLGSLVTKLIGKSTKTTCEFKPLTRTSLSISVDKHQKKDLSSVSQMVLVVFSKIKPLKTNVKISAILGWVCRF